MKIVATTIPTLGSPDEPVYKAFSSLINIPGDDTFQLGIDFFKHQHEKEPWYKDRTNFFGSRLKKIQDAIENPELYKIGRVIKDIKDEVNMGLFVKNWKNNFKGALQVRDLLPESLSKADLKKAWGGVAKAGDFFVKGRKGKPKSTLGKIFSPFDFVYDLEDIHTDFKNQSYASMSLRILSTGLGLSSAPQLQALGALFGFARFSADKLGTLAGNQVAKIFDQPQTSRAIPVDSWLVNVDLCNKNDMNEAENKTETIEEKNFVDRAKIDKSEYQNSRIISPFINKLLLATTGPDKTSVITMPSQEFKDFSQKYGSFTDNSVATHFPSFDFMQNGGDFVVDDRLTSVADQPRYTDGKGWIYDFPNAGFDLLTDFKGGSSNDTISFNLQIPSRNASGSISLSQYPQQEELGNFNLFTFIELENYDKLDGGYVAVPFSLNVNSIESEGSRLAAEVNGKYYDLGMSEDINGYIAVAPLDPT